MMKQPGFFDVEERLARLSGLGDQLEAFSRTVDFEVFRPDLEKALAYSDGSKGGRPPFDPVLMFKILVIQTLNNLSDERTEEVDPIFRTGQQALMTVIRGVQLQEAYTMTGVWCDQKLIVDLTGVPRADRRR
ncbi:transposase, partial [Gluconobacter japonicus]|uniref:transposase n=2 Tax=Gluconobacter japonicus TaxID=376620 RepID=UPI0024E13306